MGCERCFFGEGFCRERAPREEGDSEGVATVDERVVSRFEDVVSVLNGGDFCDGAGLVELFARYVGEADVADESLVLQFFECADAFFQGDGGVGSVKLVEVNLRDTEPAQAFFATAFEGGGASVGQDAIGRSFFDAALGGDEGAGWGVCEGVTHEEFVPAGTVGVCGVDESCAEGSGFLEQLNALLPVGVGSEVTGLVAEAHGAEAHPIQGGDAVE